MTTDPQPTAPGGREMMLTRIFDASRDLVWKAFTEAERLARWWGPQGYAMRVHALDFRPGGVFHYSQRSPDGQVMWGRFVYRDIVPPERLTFVTSFADEAGYIARAPFSPTWPLEILNLLTLTEAADGKTSLTLRGGPIDATEEERQTFWNAQDAVRQGFSGTFDQLAAYLADAAAGG